MADDDRAWPGEDAWIWQPGTVTRNDGTRIDVLVACAWDEKSGEYTVASAPSVRTIRDFDGNPVNIDRDGSALVTMPHPPDVERRRQEAGDTYWDIECVGPGPRGEAGPTVLNGSPFLVRMGDTKKPLAVVQVQLSLLDLPALQEALGTSDGAILLDLLDEVSPDEIRRVLPMLDGPARDHAQVLSPDAVARLIERARDRGHG
ncbi:MAG: hypothetical protein M3256_26620 [Actinomycetota bacterium]|nr:hypothetical protein [Actinomycetota bacterium]